MVRGANGCLDNVSDSAFPFRAVDPSFMGMGGLVSFIPKSARVAGSPTYLLDRDMHHLTDGSQHRGAALVFAICVAGLWSGAASVAFGQAGQGGFGSLGGVEPPGFYPTEQYYLALEIYRRGDLEQAIQAFDAAMRTTRVDVRGRWIDAIPVLAMQAECYWQLGHVAAARENIDHAIRLAVRYRGWMERVDWNQAMQPGVQLAQPSGLWPEAAAVKRLPVSRRILYRSGSLLSPEDVVRGGEIEEINLRNMDIVEIMRGLAVATYRRRIIMGPLSQQDPLVSQLLDSTRHPASSAAPIVASLVGSMRSAEHFAYYDDPQAAATAGRAAIFSGGVHPISAIAMMSQASALAGSDQPTAAIPIAANVANAAAALEQPEWVGEALQLAAGCTTTPQQAEMVQKAATTAATALHRKSPLATLHCLVAAADAAITSDNLTAAQTLLDQARTLASRRDVNQPRIDAYGAYVAARLAAASGDSFGIGGPTALDSAVGLVAKFALDQRFRNRPVASTPRLYQLAAVQQAAGTSLGGKSSEKWLRAYSDDPAADVWRRDPVDALSTVMFDMTPTTTARVQLAATRKYGEDLLKRSDDLLANRFLRRLPLGGRVAQVRYAARTPDGLLDPETLEFAEAAGAQMKELRVAAAAAQPDPLASQKLEASACAIALSRVHVPRSMPPRVTAKVPANGLPPRTGLLTFINVGNHTFATLSANGKTSMWSIASSRMLPTRIGRFLRGIGVGANRGKRMPEDQSWRTEAVTLRRQLLPDDATITADRFDDLIVVPDGPLWYVPFELLPIGDEDSPLIADKIRVRYAATPGFAFQPAAERPTSRAIGIAANLFFAPGDPEINESIIESITQSLDEPVRLNEESETPSGWLGNSVGHLLVAAPRAANLKHPLAMNLAAYDQASPAGTIAGWMRFPATVPRSVALAGFRTPVEVGQMGTGEEVFLTLCGLHASGVRSVLLSRWPVGGESTSMLMRELAQELPYSGMLESWQRARSLLRETELDPTSEPLLRKADHERLDLTGNEPLFWAGYLVSAPPSPSPRGAEPPVSRCRLRNLRIRPSSCRVPSPTTRRRPRYAAVTPDRGTRRRTLRSRRSSPHSNRRPRLRSRWSRIRPRKQQPAVCFPEPECKRTVPQSGDSRGNRSPGQPIAVG